MRNLCGTWYNEKGSKLELIVHMDGTIEGEYHTAVGGAQGVFKLSGRTDMKDFAGSRSVGFVVCWNNPAINLHSVTVWSGQYHDVSGDEVLSTTWLLTKESPPENDWASTLVGNDVFRRVAPQQPSADHPFVSQSAFPHVEPAVEAVIGV
jgi:hypothetical protein